MIRALYSSGSGSGGSSSSSRCSRRDGWMDARQPQRQRRVFNSWRAHHRSSLFAACLLLLVVLFVAAVIAVESASRSLESRLLLLLPDQQLQRWMHNRSASWRRANYYNAKQRRTRPNFSRLVDYIEERREEREKGTLQLLLLLDDCYHYWPHS